MPIPEEEINEEPAYSGILEITTTLDGAQSHLKTVRKNLEQLNKALSMAFIDVQDGHKIFDLMLSPDFEACSVHVQRFSAHLSNIEAKISVFGHAVETINKP